MVPNVEVYSVNPGAAAAAGCTASYRKVHEYHNNNQWYDEDCTYYGLSATEVPGWHFHHFEWTITRSDGFTTNNSTSNNPYGNTGEATAISDYSFVWHSGGEYEETYSNVTYCRAVFVEDPHGDITVTTEADPVAGGTTSPVSETHHYVGNPSTTFTLTATPNVGYVFEKWLHNGSEYSSNAQTTVTLYFSSSAQTKHYVAKFRISDKILHGANGTILHGSGGTILRGG